MFSSPPTSTADKADKCWKVRPLLSQVAEASQRNWTLGMHMTIDESMIKCKSRFVNWKQYMPLKPTKHGVKVFVLACGSTGYVYNYDVYQGRQSSGSASVMELVLTTLITGNLKDSGRILYTDNYYTSIALAVTLLCVYGIYLVGTYSPKKNAKKADDSFPYSKLTASDAKIVDRGWMRRATNLCTAGLHKAKVQCICWKDSKVCGFISTAFVGYCESSEVLRSVKGAYKSLKVKAHDTIIAYLRCYGAVDRADKGMGEQTISVRASRWCMRIVFWAFDVVLWNMWVIAVFFMEDKDPRYMAYKSNQGVPNGRYRFQLDLADQLVTYALESAIAEAGSKERVRWANNKKAGQFKSPKTPAEKVASPTRHELVRHDSKSYRYCQLCYRNKTSTALSKAERRKQSPKVDYKCAACDVRMCDQCFAESHK